jgi:hypothetical protein
MESFKFMNRQRFTADSFESGVASKKYRALMNVVKFRFSFKLTEGGNGQL